MPRLAVLLLLLLAPLLVEAFVLQFDRPTTNTDGSALTDLTSIALYYRASSAAPWSKVGEVGSTATTVTVEPPAVGEWSVRAVNALGIESDSSNVVLTKRPTKPVITGATK